MYSIWEGTEKVFLLRRIWEGVEKVFPLRRIWEGFYWCRTYTPFEKELRRHFHLRRLNIFQHLDLRRHWEGFLFEKELRSMELLQSSWDGFEKVRWIWEGNVPSPFVNYTLRRNLLNWCNLFQIVRNKYFTYLGWWKFINV